MVLLFALLIFASPGFAADPTPDGFQAATLLLQENKTDEAFSRFSDEWGHGQQFPALLYNWGLAAYKTQKRGLAVGLWRRALYLNPEFSLAQQALGFAEHELPKTALANEGSTWSALRKNVIDRVSLNKWLALSWLFLVGAGILLIRYFGLRKQALKTDTPLPAPPHVGVVFTGLFFVMVAFTIAKSFTLSEVLATVTPPSVALRTGPSADDNAIFDLIEGIEVRVRTVHASWAQVSMASGVSGWVPTESLFQHTGNKKLW